MLGIEDYGSGSESEHEGPAKPALPAPSDSTASKAKRPKKITIGLPTLPASDIDEQGPPAKKARTTGAGTSSLLSMLPAPKQAASVPRRILGGKSGPALTFDAPHPSPSQPLNDQETEGSLSSSSISFLPTSLAKGKANISLDAPKSVSSDRSSSADFFALGVTSTTTSPIPSQPTSSFTSYSAAPEVPTYEPPEPTATDPYPGYYQLPSGAWAAYDAAYYATFRKKWQDEYDAHVRALEKGTTKGFEGYDSASVQDVDTQKEMERARVELKEREERKALTKGAGAGATTPNMKITASKMSGIAKTRHQLATLLRDAYQNRDALEERIAEGRRNRKEAGNKYGF
ncbi:hypothetical protein APHAL10511_001140 [Amanita phalloides]|nr:hypothetical protein APHAL10511_001140 [Amanita phalloides]